MLNDKVYCTHYVLSTVEQMYSGVNKKAYCSIV